MTLKRFKKNEGLDVAKGAHSSQTCYAVERKGMGLVERAHSNLKYYALQV